MASEATGQLGRAADDSVVPEAQAANFDAALVEGRQRALVAPPARALRQP